MLYQFYSGQGSEERDATLVDAIALDFFGGYTRLATQGGWKAPDGVVYQEPGWVWVIDTSRTTASRTFGEQVRRIMGQEAVLVIAYPGTSSRLVTGEKED